MVTSRLSRVCITAGFGFAPSAPSLAMAQVAAASVEAQPAQVVVVARRPPLEHVQGEPSLASTVLSGDALHRAGQSASLVLSSVPGVQVSRTGAESDLATASIRGSDSSQVPVYLAGVRINDDVSGSADLSTVPLWMIERVEVYRGNAPVLGDRLGMGGAVFFWPRLPRSTRLGADAQAGSFGERGGWLAYEAGSERTGALVAVRRVQADNDYPFIDDRGQRFDRDEVEVRRKNADHVTHDAWAIGRLRLWPDAQLSLVVNAFEREQGLTGLSVVPAEHARGTARRYLAAASLRLPCSLGESCSIEAQASWLAARLTADDPFIELPSLRTRWVHSAGARYNVGLRATLQPSEKLELGASASQSLEALDIVRLGNLSRAAERASTRVAAFGSWRPSDLFDVHGLAALECHTTEGSADRFGVPVSVQSGLCGTLEPAARLGARAAIGAGIDVLANVGRYVRVPTLGELYGSSPLVEGSPALGVERGWTVDAGVRASVRVPEANGFASLESFAFVRSADDLVRFRRTGLSSAAPYNVASSRILGLETALAAELFDAVSVSAGATLLDPRETTHDRALDPTENDVLPLMSRLNTSLRVECFAAPGWRALEQDRVSAAVAFFHRSARYDDPAGLTVLPAQSLVDVELASSFFDAAVQARFAVRNAFDVRQLDLIGLPLPGRSAHLELEAWF